jgi:HlyD family secretion protein
MRKLAIVVVVALAVAAFFWQKSRTSAQAASYRLVTLERTDLESTVSATGNLEAVTTVEVGTQVSGIISEIHADFNDHVEAGQVIAVLDKTVLAIAVREAQANLDRSLAEQTRAQREFDRIRPLFEKGLSNAAEFNQAEYAKRAADATVNSSQLSLERAKQNLTYATIIAPISGTVLERDVDVGQTVAASLSAPRLFVLAGDLSRLQILASVDESDIGRIRPGQTARFSVQWQLHFPRLHLRLLEPQSPHLQRLSLHWLMS